MNSRRVIPAMGAGMGLMLAAGIAIPLATGSLDVHAKLSPDPEALTWRQGTAHVLVLETGLPSAQLRISGLDNHATSPGPGLGFGEIRVYEEDGLLTSGQGKGCQDDYDNDAVAPATDDYDALWLGHGDSVAVIPCPDSAAVPDTIEDLVISVHAPGEDDALASYTVDAFLPHASDAPDPGPVRFDEGDYVNRRVCADAGSPRQDIFSGGETVGAPIAAAHANGDPLTGPSYSLAPHGGALDHAYFDISSTGQLSVNIAGADDHAGLDGERLYSFLVQVQVEDAGGETAVAVATVLVDKTNLGVWNSAQDTNANGQRDGDEVDGTCP